MHQVGQGAHFLFEDQEQDRRLFSPLLKMLYILARTMKQEKEKEDIWIEKEEVIFLLWKMTWMLQVETPKETVKG